jgi:hypothetical protein
MPNGEPPKVDIYCIYFSERKMEIKMPKKRCIKKYQLGYFQKMTFHIKEILWPYLNWVSIPYCIPTRIKSSPRRYDEKMMKRRMK